MAPSASDWSSASCGKGAAGDQGSLVQGRIQPALRLGEVIAQRAALGIQGLDARLRLLVGLVVGVDGAVADPSGRGGQCLRLEKAPAGPA